MAAAVAEAPKSSADEKIEDVKPIEWAVDLIEAFEKQFVGKDRISAIRDAMAKRFNDPAHRGKPENHIDRQLTADEAIRVLEQGVADGKRGWDWTLERARALRTVGKYDGPPVPNHPSEKVQKIFNALPTKPKAPVRELTPIIEPMVVDPRDQVNDVTIGPKQLVRKEIAERVS